MRIFQGTVIVLPVLLASAVPLCLYITLSYSRFFCLAVVIAVHMTLLLNTGHPLLESQGGCIQGCGIGSSDIPRERLPPSLSPLWLHPATLTYLLKDKYMEEAKVNVIPTFTA